MPRKATVLILALLLAPLLAAVASAQAPADEAPVPAWLAPKTFEERPGRYFYLFQDTALWQQGLFSVERRVTLDSVTAPAALEFFFPAIDGPAGVFSLDLNQAMERGEGQPPVDAAAVGLSLYVKGDGSSGTGVIGLSDNTGVLGSTATFPLSDTTWRRLFVRFDQFQPAISADAIMSLNFSVTEGTERPVSYIVDAIRFETTGEPDPEVQYLAEAANRREGPIAAPRRIAPAACCYSRGGIAKARARLRRGEPLKWLAYGDSVTVPVQMWNIMPEDLRPRYAYYRQAAALLEKEFGSPISITVDAVGGRQLSENFDSLLNSLQTEKPDVLVLHPWDTARNYAVYLPRAVAAAREVGAETLVLVPVYDEPERTAEAAWLRQWCIENGVACADTREYLLGRGFAFWSQGFANDYHPGPDGHWLMGQVVAEMFR